MVYNDLQPVVVYIDGDDLSQEEEEALQPSASLAHDHKTVFVSVNYRYVLFSLIFKNIPMIFACKGHQK